MQENANIQFVTAEKLNVTDRIKKGLTQKFKCRKEAQAYADQKRSYVYDLLYYVVEGSKTSQSRPFGYAVPN